MSKIFSSIAIISFVGAIFSLLNGHLEGPWAWLSIPFVWEPKLDQAIALGVVSIGGMSFLIWDELCKLTSNQKK